MKRACSLVAAVAMVVLQTSTIFAAEPRSVLVFATADEPEKLPPRPTPQNPAYYAVIAGGYFHDGPSVAGDHPEKVTAEEIWPTLQKELASQGYLLAAEGTTPSLVIVFHWGDMSPLFGNSTFLNAKKMSELTGASRVVNGTPEFENAYQNSVESRYMLVVSAFDYESAKEKNKKLLWRTRLSAHVGGTTLQESIVPLLRTGASFFGRDSGLGQEVKWDRAKVTVGEATVVPELPATTSPKP